MPAPNGFILKENKLSDENR